MSSPVSIETNNTTFVVVSFEGPDRYSMAGCLGARVSHLSRTLASLGFDTHLLFIGDPLKGGCERSLDGKLTLHRWCQWISRYHPDGVYQAEEEKLRDFQESAPPFIASEIIRPAVRQGKLVVVLAEEWQTAGSVCRLGDLLKAEGVWDRVLTLWNANSTQSFERIDWARLSRSAVLTTVSHYMKYLMWQLELCPMVIPNGIPRSMLRKVGGDKIGAMWRALGSKLVLSKIAYWYPHKRWDTAIEATARLKSKGRPILLLARGCAEASEGEVADLARRVGLTVKDVICEGSTTEARLAAIEEASEADVLNLKFWPHEELRRIIYCAADEVLANSGHEPFGQMALEAMAAGGIAFTGCTGEEYAVPLENAVVLETDDPQEIVEYVTYLEDNREKKESIRKAARRMARHYTWEEIVSLLIGRLEYLAATRAA